MIIFLDRRRIHEFLFHESPYDPDTSPILNHTHQHPVEVDVWIEIHTINEGFYLSFLIQSFYINGSPSKNSVLKMPLVATFPKQLPENDSHYKHRNLKQTLFQ